MSCLRRLGPLTSRDALILAAVVTAGCTSVPTSERKSTDQGDSANPVPALIQVSPPPPPPPPPPGTDAAFEQQTREQADQLMEAGRWAEAVVQWEILTLFRPHQAEYAGKLAEARNQASNSASESLVAAVEARKRGETRRAETLYLRALSADPGSVAAADALREMERERATSAYSSQMARASIAPRSRSTARKVSETDRRDFDAAVMLMHQGDYSASVQNLQGYLKRYPQDETGKRALADAYAALGKQRIDEGRKEEGLNYLEQARGNKSTAGADMDATAKATRKELAQDYYEQGLRAQRTDLPAAIRLWERSLEYDPQHAQARLKLDQARRMQQTLESIPGENAKP